MESKMDYGISQKNLKDRLDEETGRLKRSKQKLGAASMMDFASNLLSLAGYNKGARISLATNSVEAYQAAYEKVRERYNAALRDYKATIADTNLRHKLGQNAIGGNAPLKPVGFMTASSRPLPMSRSIKNSNKSNNDNRLNYNL